MLRVIGCLSAMARARSRSLTRRAWRRLPTSHSRRTLRASKLMNAPHGPLSICPMQGRSRLSISRRVKPSRHCPPRAIARIFRWLSIARRDESLWFFAARRGCWCCRKRVRSSPMSIPAAMPTTCLWMRSAAACMSAAVPALSMCLRKAPVLISGLLEFRPRPARAPRYLFPSSIVCLSRCGRVPASPRRFGCSGQPHDTNPMTMVETAPARAGGTRDAVRILAARGLRAFGDGCVSLLVPIYLLQLGFSALEIGAIVTSTLIGTALVTLWAGMVANRYSVRRLLLAAALLMIATGAGVAMTTAFWPLLLIAFVGTMNPTSGDASIFLPLEQAALAQTAEPRRRTALFARYSLIGSLAGAVGILAASAPDLLSDWLGAGRVATMQAMFVAYAGFGVVSLLLYLPLAPAIEAFDSAEQKPLGKSKRLVYGLAA